MSPLRASIFTASCVVPLLLCQSCTPREVDQTGASTARPENRQRDDLRVRGITEVDDRTLIELPAGSDDGVDVASFFRVYDPAQQGVIKCMLKVDEVLGPHHSVGVIIGGLFDIANPVAVGDPVKRVEDLALIGGGFAVEREVRLEQHRLDQADAETRAAFTKLRENYQRRLRKLVEERDEALAEQQARHERELLQRDREHERQLAQKDLERRSDLAALRSAMLSEAAEQVRQARKESRARIVELEGERETLQGQVDALLSEQQRLLTRIQRLVEREAELRRNHEQTLRAEVETRQILENRLAQIERNLAPDEVDDTTLTNDPERNETVLERLDRITGERETARRKASLLEGQIEQLQQQLRLAEERLTHSGRELARLRQRQGQESDLAERVSTLEQQLATTREHLDAANLARFESERQYYELMLRVLRLPEGRGEQLAFLKERLRSLATAPERDTEASP